jgi:pyruvate dehydrogenase E2 component (dihydrolipoamide acetyltransferase)
MAKRVIMPALGMAQESGLIVTWLKNEGEMVQVGEPLLEIETDKTTAELEAEATGVLTHITAFAGDNVPVATTIAWILAPGEAVPGEIEGTRRREEEENEGISAPQSSPPLPLAVSPVAARMAQEHNLNLDLVKPEGGKVSKQDVLAYLARAGEQGESEGRRGKGEERKLASRPSLLALHALLLPASPKARRLAAERGYDLAQISGSGPDGAVLTADVLAYQPPLASPSALSQSWRVMAQRLSQSWQSVPHFYLTREVDATALLHWQSVAQKKTEKLTITDLLVKAVAAALGQHPRLNAYWIDDDIQLNDEINVGIAVAIEDGLLVPVIHNADGLSVADISLTRQAIVSRTLAGKLKVSDLQGGTFTISNLGMYGIDAFSAIVNPPQAAILAVGKIADRVVPINGEVTIRPMLVLTLSLDHRVVDGARGAQFMDSLVSYLEEPLNIL